MDIWTGTGFLLGVSLAVYEFIPVWATRRHRNREWYKKCAVGSAGVLMVIVSLGKEIKSDRDIAAARQTINVHEERFSSRAEKLTPSVRAQLVRRLRKLPAKSVHLVFDERDQETGDFAQILKEILDDTGRLHSSGMVSVIGGDSTITGIHVSSFDTEHQRFAVELCKALHEAQLPGVQRTQESPRLTTTKNNAPIMWLQSGPLVKLVVLRKWHPVAARNQTRKLDTF